MPTKDNPVMTKHGFLDCQVCVPDDWDDEAIKRFAESEYPCGTTLGWNIRKAGDPFLEDDPERQPCSERKGFVHVMLDA